jgi:hypothetical protein
LQCRGIKDLEWNLCYVPDVLIVTLTYIFWYSKVLRIDKGAIFIIRVKLVQVTERVIEL